MTRLIVVTLLLAVVAIFLKLRTRKTTSTRSIKVTSRITIGRGSMIAVVEVDGRRLLVGAAPNQVSLIAELADTPPLDPSPTSPIVSAPFGPSPASPASPAPAALPRSVTVEGAPSTLVDRVRRMTARTVEPRLRLPHQSGGAT
jgi:hypothetical protein